MGILNFKASNDQTDSRRIHPRHKAGNCIVLIDGKAYPVHNWSEGGLLIQGDDRMFSTDAPVELTMKFRLGSRLLDIAQRGHIVRKTRNALAVQFDAVQQDVTRKFKQVIDDMVTREFAESQLA